MPKAPILSSAESKQLEAYLTEHGFCGQITINDGAKNWQAIKRLVKQDDFYTFGIEAIQNALQQKRVDAKSVRGILIDASGLSVKRFLRRGAGYFDPAKSATAVAAAMLELKAAAKAGTRVLFATGHPGAMLGLMLELSTWATKLGAVVVSNPPPLDGRKGKLSLDLAGSVYLPSDLCSAWHSHESSLLSPLLADTSVDLVVADHGFAGAALNQGIRTIGFYDTDDPGMPLAAHLGQPLLAVPINDNRPNHVSANLGRFLTKFFS